MTVPAFILAPNYYANAAVDDVQDILNDLDVILAAAGWTVAGAGGPYTTPADPDGRYFTLTFTWISATRLDCYMTDEWRKVTTVREIQITGTQTIEYYYGDRYLYIVNTGQDDCIFASLLSLSPESEVSHQNHCVFQGTRTSAGARSNYTVGSLEQIGNTGVYVAQTTNQFLMYGSPQIAGPQPYCQQHVSGARSWFPCWVGGDDSSLDGYRGKLYNSLLGHSSYCAIGNEYSIPLDDSTVGVFKVIRIPTANASLHLVRKS